MSDFDGALKRIYDLATLRNVFEQDLNGPEWSDYTKIRDAHDRARDHEKQDYKENFQARFGEEMRKLINEDGSKGYDFTYDMVGKNAFDPQRLNSEADRRVRLNHKSAIDAIDQSELDQLQDLYDRSSIRKRREAIDRNAPDRNRNMDKLGRSGPRRSFD